MNFFRKKSNAYIWNMLGGFLNAFQSVILLMVITRTVDLYSAGIFTIAYASANLFLTIGKYGMRNYQVTDIKPRFSFDEYLFSRLYTCTAMIVISAGYTIYKFNAGGYSIEKAAVVFFMCMLKVIDAAEDVYHGMYQQQGRLDVGAKLLTVRTASMIGIFSIGLIFFRNLLKALVLTVGVNIVLAVVLIKLTFPEFKAEVSFRSREKRQAQILDLLKICFPLFAGTFLSFYIGNAPKYAIDSLLSEEIQACYGFISMPVFVIGLLNGFIYQPILNDLALKWNEGKRAVFLKQVLKQFVYVGLITGAALVGGYLLGIPVLSLLYNTDLNGYRIELLILLLGGGMLALSGFLLVVLTVMRCQKNTIWGYLLVAIMAYLFSPVFVKHSGVRGAAVLYLLLMSLLTFLFLLLFVYNFVKVEKRDK